MGRHVKLEQDSDEWKEWRSTRWMASESGAIMGVNPRWMEVKTWEDLRLLKAGLIETGEFARKAFAWGHKHERSARNHFMASEHCPLPPPGFEGGDRMYLWDPACMESMTNPKIAASLDGLAVDERDNAWHVLELKCPMRPTSRLLKVKTWGEIPEYYRWQMLHQFVATDLRQATMHFYVRHPVTGGTGAYVRRVFTQERDSEPIAKLLYSWHRFEAGEDEE